MLTFSHLTPQPPQASDFPHSKGVLPPSAAGLTLGETKLTNALACLPAKTRYELLTQLL